jgi:uncharacterized membrane protein YraQ (UPF0718 family)
MKSIKSLLGLLPQMSFILIVIGLSLSMLSTETISEIIGENSGIAGIAMAIATGAVTLVPSVIAFPLGATLLDQGAGLLQIAGFLAALMGIGIVTFPMEKQFFGTEFALYRNIGTLVMTITFVLAISVLMGGTA